MCFPSKQYRLNKGFCRPRLKQCLVVKFAVLFDFRLLRVAENQCRASVAAAMARDRRGASAIEFGLTGIRRTPVGTKAFLEQLERHLLLVYLGKPRFSGANNWELFKRHIEGNQKTVALFEALKENAISMRNAFLNQDVARIADLLNRDWEIRRRALPAMSSPAIDRLIRALRRAGAIGARVCGAGGGGCLALLIEPKARVRLGEIAASAGARTLPCSINMRGLVVRRLKH